MSCRHLVDAFTLHLISLDKAQSIPALTFSNPPSPLQFLTALSAPRGSHGWLCRPQDPVTAQQAATPSKPRSLPALSVDPCLLILGMTGQDNMTEQ